MEVVIVPTAADGGKLVAAEIAAAATATPDLVLGVATGSSPLPTYQALIDHAASGVDFSRLRCFALDEYVGLDPSHPASYHDVVRREIVEPIGINPANVTVPDGLATDLPAACEAFEAAITEAGGVAIQLLGIGGDGHIGFNEPSSSLSSRTRIKTLTAQTRADNARFFDDASQVPRHCVTQGLATILHARHVILVASGPKKAHAIAAAVEGPVTAMCPASVIQFHPHVTVVVDEEAASELVLADYYRSTYAAKPDWQRL